MAAYTNRFRVQARQSEFFLDFAAEAPTGGPELVARLAMLPRMAKLVLRQLERSRSRLRWCCRNSRTSR
jgi:hypothetical protein